MLLKLSIELNCLCKLAIIVINDDRAEIICLYFGLHYYAVRFLHASHTIFSTIRDQN